VSATVRDGQAGRLSHVQAHSPLFDVVDRGGKTQDENHQ
jgi:hypothetical protein